MAKWNTPLVGFACVNVVLGVAIWVILGFNSGFHSLRVMAHAQRFEQSGAVDAERLGKYLGLRGPAGRADLEEAMGLDDARRAGRVGFGFGVVLLGSAVGMVLTGRLAPKPQG